MKLPRGTSKRSPGAHRLEWQRGTRNHSRAARLPNDWSVSASFLSAVRSPIVVRVSERPFGEPSTLTATKTYIKIDCFLRRTRWID